MKGKVVLVTSSGEIADEECRSLVAAGATPIRIPLIEIRDPADRFAALDAALARLDFYAWILFTSRSAVRAFTARLRGGLPPPGCAVAAVGPGTARALERAGIKAAVVAQKPCAEKLVEALRGRLTEGDRVLWPRAKDARTVLSDRLRAEGISVDDVEAYATEVPEGLEGGHLSRIVRERAADAILFDSPSAVRHFVALVGQEEARRFLRQTQPIPIGPVTAQAIAEEIGLQGL